MSVVYLGGAIDHASEESLALFDKVAGVISSVGEINPVIYNPFSAFRNANVVPDPTNDKAVMEINNHALLTADLAVFIWSGSPSFGVPCEILSRVEDDMPVVIYNCSGKHPGIYMRGIIANLGQRGRIVDDEGSLVEALKTGIKEHGP